MEFDVFTPIWYMIIKVAFKLEGYLESESLDKGWKK